MWLLSVSHTVLSVPPRGSTISCSSWQLWLITGVQAGTYVKDCLLHECFTESLVLLAMHICVGYLLSYQWQHLVVKLTLVLCLTRRLIGLCGRWRTINGLSVFKQNHLIYVHVCTEFICFRSPSHLFLLVCTCLVPNAFAWIPQLFQPVATLEDNFWVEVSLSESVVHALSSRLKWWLWCLEVKVDNRFVRKQFE